MASGEDELLDPSSRCGDEVALLEVRSRGFEDFGQSKSTHLLTHLDRRDIEAGRVFEVAEPTTLGRVVGQVQRLDEDVIFFEFAPPGT